MSNNKYMVVPVADLTPAILGKLKGYGQNQDYLFIEDTEASLVKAKRIDNNAEYVILKVAEHVTPPEIREYLPGYGTGNDPYKRIYAGNNSFITFLAENFQDAH